MFAGWQAFYQMTGGSAATLTGLLFIVASLATGRRSADASATGQRLFTTPTVFHLLSVLVISGLVLIPDGEGPAQMAILIVWSGAGLIYGLGRLVGILRLPNRSHWSDVWWYGFAPAVVYVALAAASVSAGLGAPHAAFAVALCLMGLLTVAIRNAWDLVTWLAPRRDDPGPPAP